MDGWIDGFLWELVGADEPVGFAFKGWIGLDRGRLGASGGPEAAGLSDVLDGAGESVAA